MRTPGWRWCAVLALTTVLASLPTVVAQVPTHVPEVDAATLLARVQRSDRVGWSGYGEARGDLILPDVGELGDLPELISGSTRLRAWWRGPEDHRVDALTLSGETGVAVDGDATWTWESADRLATLVRGAVDVRLPRGADLLAPALGVRLSRSDAAIAEALRHRRVAGVGVAGLRLRPAKPDTTTIGHVDLWIEPRTGLALRVEVHPRDVDAAALTSVLLDLDLSTPRPARTAFRPPRDATVAVVDAPDIAAAADRFAPFRLPATLAGLPRRERLGDLSEGVATYGEGFTALTVVPLEGRTAGGLLRRLQRDGDRAGEALFSSVLLQGRVARDRDRAYLLAGTVPQDVLGVALAQLRRTPPPRRSS